MSYRRPSPVVEELVVHVCRFCGELRSICDAKSPGADLAGARCAFLRELHSEEERREDELAARLVVADDFTRNVRPPSISTGSLVLAALALLLLFVAHASAKPRCDLRGRVKIVEHDADYRVRVVDAFADLDVQRVEALPGRSGQWQIVDTFPDFTVQLVDVGEDLRVRFVRAFPGCAR